MRKIFLMVVAALASLSLGYAQEASTTWPYVYPEFTEGSVLLSQKGRKEGVKLNICLDGMKLHFIDGEMVKSMGAAEVLSAQIGQDVYQNVGGRMLKVLGKSDKCLVVEDKEIDYATLNSTGAAYGSSSNTLGTMKLSSLEGIGGSNSNRSLNHMELLHNKDNGQELPLIAKEYIFVKGTKVFCTKKDVMEAAPDKDAMKQFLKENSIKWKEVPSLLAVGDFLSDQIK